MKVIKVNGVKYARMGCADWKALSRESWETRHPVLAMVVGAVVFVGVFVGLVCL